MIKRLTVYFISVLILGFGIVLNTKAGLGVGSITTLSYAISEMTKLTLGNVTTLLYFVYAAIQLSIYRKLNIKVLLQIPFSFFMGAIIDFYDNLLNFSVDSFIMKLVILAIAIVTTALGAYVMVTMDFIANPADGMVKAFSYATHKEFGYTKRIFDCSMIVLTAVITLFFAQRIIGIGLGTVISAIFIGKVIQVYAKLLNPALESILEESRRKNKKYNEKQSINSNS